MFLLPSLVLVFGAAPLAREPSGPVLLHKLDSGHGTHNTRGAAFSPDGRSLATACDGGILNVWDVGTGKARFTTKAAGGFGSVDYSRDGSLLVTAGNDRIVRLFDSKTGKEAKTFTGFPNSVYVARLTPDSKRVVASGLDQNTRIWDVSTGKEVRTLASGTCYALAVSPDGKYAVTAGDKHALTLWNIDTGTKVREMPGHTGVVVWLEFSHDGRTIASASYDSSIRLWETRSGKQRLNIANIGNSPRAVMFPADGRTLAAVNYDTMTRVYDSVTGKELFGEKGSAMGYAVAISRDGRRLCGGTGAQLRVWDVSAVTRKKAAEMASTTFDDHWKALGDDDVAESYKAVVALSVPAAVKHFSGRFKPAKPLTDEAKKRAPQLIRTLGDDDEEKWRKASDELGSYGPAILPTLQEALKKETDPDVKLRLIVTIGRADVRGSEELRRLRAIEALERLGTAEAVKVLQMLEKASSGEVAAEAKATLARLKRQE